MIVSDEFRSVIVSAITRQFFALETVYRRNVNTNKDYARSVAERCLQLSKLYSLLCDGGQFVTDSASLREYLYGQVELELV